MPVAVPNCFRTDSSGPKPTEKESALMTTRDLDSAIDRAKQITVTEEQREAQRRSFVFGNTKIEFDALTREDVEAIANSQVDTVVKNG